MNSNQSLRMIAAGMLAAIAAAPGLAQTPRQGAVSVVAAKPQASGGQLSVVAAEALDESGDQQSIEIRVENDKVYAKRNGREIPQSQIRREGGRIILTDEQGNEIKDIHIFQPATMDQLMTLSTGDHEGLFKVLTNVQGQALGSVQNEPKVVIGVQMGDPGPALEKHLKLKPGQCTMITGVYEGLPAEQAGLGEFDIIVDVAGQEKADRDSLQKAISSREPGDTIQLTVIQAGEKRNLTIQVAPYDAKKMASAKFQGQALPFAGVWSSEIAPQMGQWQMTAPQIAELYRHAMPPVIVAPELDHQKLRDSIKPPAESKLRELREKSADQNLDQKLEQLDERMSDLEKLLEKLIEKQGSR